MGRFIAGLCEQCVKVLVFSASIMMGLVVITWSSSKSVALTQVVYGRRKTKEKNG